MSILQKMVNLGCLILFLAPMVWAQDKCEAPVWNVGDKWTYKDATGGTFTNEIVDVKEDLFIAKIAGVQDLYAYDKKNMNVKFLIERSGRKVKNTSNFRKLLDFPIFLGKKWTDTVTATPLGWTTEVTYINDFRIENILEVTIPAGTFRTYVIHYKQRNMTTGPDGWMRFWYSPEAKTWIKREIEKSDFWARMRQRDAELISYQLK